MGAGADCMLLQEGEVCAGLFMKEHCRDLCGLCEERECPWFGTSTDGEYTMQCSDGSKCDVLADGWNCCTHHGGRAVCPASTPFMCVDRSCGDNDYCCATQAHCELYRGGVRTCRGEPDPRLVAISSTSTRVVSTTPEPISTTADDDGEAETTTPEPTSTTTTTIAPGGGDDGEAGEAETTTPEPTTSSGVGLECDGGVALPGTSAARLSLCQYCVADSRPVCGAASRVQYVGRAACTPPAVGPDRSRATGT